MPNDKQLETFHYICKEIERLRIHVGPPDPPPTQLHDSLDPAKDGYRGQTNRKPAFFRVGRARVFIEEDGRVLDDGMPDCPRYSSFVMRDFLHVIAADLLMEGSPHKPFLDLNSHTRESFESYLQTGVPLAKELPFPIAIVSRKLGNEANGLMSFLLMLDLFEVIIRFIVLIQIADSLSGSEEEQAKVLEWCRYNSKNPQLNFSTLYLGDWVSLFRSLPKFSSRSLPQRPFLAEMSELNIDEDMLRRFVKLRNDYRGHGRTLTETDYKSLFEGNIEHLRNKLLHKVSSFLRNYWLVKVIDMRKDRDRLSASVWKLMGDNPSFDKRNIPLEKPLPTNKVVYLKRNSSRGDLGVLDLDPYMIIERCKKCDREELLLFDGDFEKDVKYLAYDSCPWHHKSSYSYGDRLPRLLREANRPRR